MNDKTYKELLTHFDSVEQIDELLTGLAQATRGAEKAQLLATRVKFREKAARTQATIAPAESRQGDIMTTRYKAKVGSTNPDLDMLNTLDAEHDAVYQQYGESVAKECARGTLDFHRLKARPPQNAAALRAALVHALGAPLAAKVFGRSLKQAPADEFDQLVTQIADAARARAMALGGDKAQTLKYLQNVLAQISGQQNAGNATLADDEKAMTKEARWSAARNALDGQLMGAAGAARAMTQGAQELSDALGMHNDPWYK